MLAVEVRDGNPCLVDGDKVLLRLQDENMLEAALLLRQGIDSQTDMLSPNGALVYIKRLGEADCDYCNGTATVSIGSYVEGPSLEVCDHCRQDVAATISEYTEEHADKYLGDAL